MIGHYIVLRFAKTRVIVNINNDKEKINVTMKNSRSFVNNKFRKVDVFNL